VGDEVRVCYAHSTYIKNTLLDLADRLFGPYIYQDRSYSMTVETDFFTVHALINMH